MSIFPHPPKSLALNIFHRGKAGGSQLSLESICSSGYDSAQSESRTATPMDLQMDIPECSSGNCTPTHAHHIKRLGLSLPQLYQDPNKLAQGLDETLTSCADALSLCSGSTAFSCYSCFSSNGRPLSAASLRTPSLASESCDSLTANVSVDHENYNDSIASQMICKLKRRSDGWTGPLVKKADPILSRLKRGRAEAIRRQEVIEAFLSEAFSQLEIQAEASKAQSTCVNSVDLEYFEAERLILLAGERYGAYMSEAQQLVTEFGQSLTPECEPLEDIDGDLPCLATLYLNGIKLILCDDFVRRLNSSMATHYCLCLVKESRTKGITATHIGSISSSNSSDNTFRIEFNNCFTLSWMPEDFQLDIEVYHLAIDGTSQPLKQKFMNVISNLAQRSPVRCKPRRLLGSCVLPLTENQGTTERKGPLLSKFQKIGSVSITRSSLNQRVFNLKEHSNVVCAVQVHLQADPDLTLVMDVLPLQGYLSVFGGVEWERRWFVLTSHSLSYWLYPDQPEYSEPPVSTWSLSECSTAPELADPNICAWDHSFVLPLQTHKANKLILSAESKAQMNQWMTLLNTLISCTSTWKQ